MTRSRGLPLVVWVSLLTAIPVVGLAILAVREVRSNVERADAAVDVVQAVEEQSAAIAVLTPLQIERIGALGTARLLKLGLDPEQILAVVAGDYADLLEQNTVVFGSTVDTFAVAVEAHDYGDRPDLRPTITEAIAAVDRSRGELAAGTAAVDETKQAYDSLLSAINLFLDETVDSFRSAQPEVFDAQRLLGEQDVNRLVIRTANLEIALIADIVTGIDTLDIVELIAVQTVHDEALSRAVEQRGDELDELTETREALRPLGSIWSETAPVTPERVAIEPALYDEFAMLLAERLEYLEAVEMVTIDAGSEVVAGAREESDRITRENRQTLFGLLAIGLGILIFEFAIIRSLARPLGRLRRHAERIGAGDLAMAELPVDGPSDIRRVTGSVNEMVGTLDAVDRQLKRLATGVALDATPAVIPGEVGASIRDSVDRLVALTGELRESEERLQAEARRDNLTQRLNRFGVLEHIEFELREPGPPFAVMIVDLDGFKNVNDTNGQAIGDRMLRDVADRLSATVDAGGVVARIGGDEFLIVAPDHHDEAAAHALGARLIDAIEQPFRFEGFALSISASVGACLADGADDALVVVEQADAAVYHAKRRGRGRVEMYDAELQDAIERAAEIELALRDGIDNGELVLHLQPTVHAATGMTAGAEALVRWDRPGLGLVAPADFIPIAERSGLIIEIGRWVLHSACRIVAGWQQRDPQCTARLAVNVSGRHLVEADLVRDLDDALAATGADPRLLELELTESHLLDDIGRVSAVLDDVRRRGVAVAVDDFGTGYSSMTYLQRLPLDAVKVDRSFVERATERGFDSVVIESIVRLGRVLELEIVAEGVETQPQLDWLRHSGVHRLQGFLIAQPMPVAEAEAVMFSGRPLA